MRLERDDVHVWSSRFARMERCAEDMERILSPDELARAGKFRFRKDRLNFILGRGALRTILSRYVGIAPADLSFRYNPYGKPEIAPGMNRAEICFNLSHAGGIAVFAVNRARPIGIDVESVHADVDFPEIMKRHFSREEMSAVTSLPPEEQKSAFIAAWTRKESFLKAGGSGISGISSGGRRGEAEERWSIVDIDLGPDYKAAVAVEGKDLNLTILHLEEHIGKWDPPSPSV